MRYTREIFIEKANAVHNHKFNYDKLIYINSTTKIIITCPIHGDFLQVPSCHLYGDGCDACSGRKKLTFNEFLEKANKKHNFKFDYSKVIYKNCATKVEIICPKHGSFWQKPQSHFMYGCGKCAGVSKLPLNEFIEKANKFHNFKYDYLLVSLSFKSASSILKIICPNHGVFEQKANAHLKYGCALCGNNSIIYFKDDLVELFKDRDYKYILDKEKYLVSDEINIICEKHGNFIQDLSRCLDNSICQKCYFEHLGELQKLKAVTKEQFIERSIIGHSAKYDYSKVEWIDYYTKVIIICPIHGDFLQSPCNHLSPGNRGIGEALVGCQKCAKNISKQETTWLDSLNIKQEYRNKTLMIDGHRFCPDAYDPDINTIYEFYGDYWHGNPNVYNHDNINTANKKSFKILFEKTLLREDFLKSRGYNIISIWENDWKIIAKNSKKNIKGK